MNIKKITIIILSALFVIYISNLLFNKNHKNKPITEITTIINQSDIIKPTIGTIQDVITFTGDLSPANSVIVSSELDAQVERVFVSEGQFVDKNSTLAILDSTDTSEALHKAQSELSMANLKAKLDKNKLERQKDLYDQGFISKLAYDELQTNYLASYQSVLQEQAEVKRAEKQLSFTIIKAPLSGYIFKKYTEVGELASKNNKLFSIASLDEMEIKAPISSDQINLISVGQRITFTVETNKQIYEGKITRINPVAEDGTRSYMVYITFDNRQYKLKSGQFVKGQIIVKSLNNVIYIPSDAIFKKNDNRNYVLVVDKNIIIEKPVTIKLKNNLLNFTSVDGLNINDIVVSSSATLKVGQHVKFADTNTSN